MSRTAADACDGRPDVMPSLATSRNSWSLRLPRDRSLHLDTRPRVMGVVNITPDSFSDGGRYLQPERAVEHGLRLLEEGANLLDLGAESTRPGGGVYGEGAALVPPEEELDRLLPVLERLRAATEAPLSIDTRKGSVARLALEMGADLINDISNLADPELGEAVAATGCPLVLMHSRGELATMQEDIHFADTLEEVVAELEDAAARAEGLGVAREQLVFDPGIGFGKTWRQNLEILGRLEILRSRGRPVLLGASRKSFIGEVTGADAGRRLPGSLAAAGWAALQGIAMVRVHDVAETVQFLETWQAIADAARPEPGCSIAHETGLTPADEGGVGGRRG